MNAADTSNRSAISVFDMLKVGVGPSSSHTLGPWRAAEQFLAVLADRRHEVIGIEVDLFGSLAKTGRGHGTGIAVLMGLEGHDPETCDVELIPALGDVLAERGTLLLGGNHPVPFDRERDVRFRGDRTLAFHPNGMTLRATLTDATTLEHTAYSVGGGFVVTEHDAGATAVDLVALPHPIESAADLAEWCADGDRSIAGVVRRNERTWRSDAEIDTDLLRIRDVMIECVFRGVRTRGVLPGGLDVTRRAADLHDRLMEPADSFETASGWFDAVRGSRPNFEHTVKWVSCFALAVNEENAAFGRVVTAPTNGAAGVLPAVLLHYLATADTDDLDAASVRFLMVAAEIGSIFKKRATISAAMGGCQAEIGVSSAMAAAALVEGRGGSVHQALMAAEIAMEHHLGLTCDPIGGLVQVPCIERNAMGAMKAITAAHLALSSVPERARVSLDDVIETMWATAQDMSVKYKETAEGGLAVRIPVSVIEC